MSHEPLACILSPDLLYVRARESTDEHRSAILQTLELDQSFRLRRAELAARHVARPADALVEAVGGRPNRSIYDQEHSTSYISGHWCARRGRGRSAMSR
jgi:hypothetical protein